MTKTEQFIKILSGIFDTSFVFDSSKHDFADYQKGVTDELIKKLYELSTNEQREGLLDHTFKGFLGDGKDYVFSQICQIEEGKITKHDFTKKEYAFLLNCLRVLNGVILDVSEACLTYDINFTVIINNSLRSLDTPKGLFAYYMKTPLGDVKRPTQQTDIAAPIKAAFCKLVEQSGLVVKGDLSNSAYCDKVCNKFHLQHTPDIIEQMRQAYSKQSTTKQIQKVETLILPTLNATDSEKIQQQINNSKK